MLKALLVLWIIAMCQPAEAETRVYGPDADGDSVVLTQDDCPLPFVTSIRLMKATLTNERGTILGCWTEAEDGFRIAWEPNMQYRRWYMPKDKFRKVSTL